MSTATEEQTMKNLDAVFVDIAADSTEVEREWADRVIHPTDAEAEAFLAEGPDPLEDLAIPARDEILDEIELAGTEAGWA
jgi:hypothetical protein